jgi:hypothetical protein
MIRSIAFGGATLILAFFMGDIGQFMTQEVPAETAAQRVYEQEHDSKV